MKDILQEFLRRTPVFIVLLGIILFLVGVAGEISISSFTFSISSNLGQIATTILGIILCGIGIFSLFREQDPKEKNKPLQDDLYGILLTQEQVFSQSESFVKRMHDANEICLVGITFVQFLMTFREPLTSAISGGARLRIMLIDPDSTAARLLVENSEMESNFANDVKRSLEYLSLIAKYSQNNGHERVNIKLVNWIPSSSLILFDPYKENGVARVTVYPPCYNTSVSRRAHFELTHEKDSYWYEIFVDQYERLWKQGKEYSISIGSDIPLVKPN